MQAKIRLMLWKLGISQKALSKLLHINKKTLSLKMQGKADFWWREVVAICSILGVDNPREIFETHPLISQTNNEKR